MDACTVTAFDVITAFAVSVPGLPLAELAGFFGPESPVNRFTGPITQSTSDQTLFISSDLSTVDARHPILRSWVVNNQELCKRNIFLVGDARAKPAENADTGR